jgi:putative (di)nucleoside polyphosphate hydrolase
VQTAQPEFSRWKWTDPTTLLDQIVEFKRDLYGEVLEEFAEHIGHVSR